MKQVRAYTPLLISIAVFGQTSDTAARFELADVHAAAKTNLLFPRFYPPRNGRYEAKNTTMVDLIRKAYGFEDDKILGGPNWIEMDRFDIIAKEPPRANAETRKSMLQALLADRFGLVVRQETRMMPAYALTAGKSLRMKQADGSERPGCRTAPASTGPGTGENRMTIGGPNGLTSFDLGPGQTIPFLCRNITMASFAEGLPRMFGTSLGTKRVIDETDLKGAWNFDVKWSIQMFGPARPDSGERITVLDALQKQLGLKLEDRDFPTPVIAVEKVNRTPTANPPGVAEALPKIPAPTAFELADVKPSAPGARGGSLRVQPGGRVVAQTAAMRLLVNRAFSVFNSDEIVGLPDWVNTARFDITAKTPEGTAATMDDLPVLLRNLLVDRFKLKYHTEERELSAYSLVSVKPKMKKADPESRAYCKEEDAPPPGPLNARSLVCQNVTMAQFADRLLNAARELRLPVLDETGIEANWDFRLTYTMNFGQPPGRGADASPDGSVPIASEPTGGIDIFEAVQKQLGLKLESRKRRLPVTVIDHLEQQPTEN